MDCIVMAADTVTYGDYFPMRGDGPCRIAVSVMPAGGPRPVVLEFPITTAPVGRAPSGARSSAESAGALS